MTRRFKVGDSVPMKTNMGLYVSRQSATFLLREVERNKASSFLIPPYIAMLCAGIEGRINEQYIDHFFRHFGAQYMTFARPCLYLPIADRIGLLAPILSDCRWELDASSTDVKDLLSLFEVRNKLLHIKLHWHAGTALNVENWQFKYTEEAKRDPYGVAGDLATLYPVAFLRHQLDLYEKVARDFYGLTYAFGRKDYLGRGWFRRSSKKRSKAGSSARQHKARLSSREHR